MRAAIRKTNTHKKNSIINVDEMKWNFYREKKTYSEYTKNATHPKDRSAATV